MPEPGANRQLTAPQALLPLLGWGGRGLLASRAVPAAFSAPTAMACPAMPSSAAPEGYPASGWSRSEFPVEPTMMRPAAAAISMPALVSALFLAARMLMLATWALPLEESSAV